MEVIAIMHMRVAALDDIEYIEALMTVSMAELLPKFLDAKQVERSR